ncbi:hypothetical protein UPYG_G00083600 [Umbra pygmaea]|uniref:Link domain-containing protein n=1 Tax=Umbra pygmaea TaxID=75934 RepID=A0ABD0XE86_UMBPY
MLHVWILSLLLPLKLAFSGQHDPSKIHAFPDEIAGVFQVSYKNHLNQFIYAYNASEARDACLSLGVTLASNAQVEEAQKQGLETCRFGWIDEHFAVIPRIVPSVPCGQNRTGVIRWRAAVTKPFDVFCFNVSARRLEDITTDSPLTTGVRPHPSISGVASSPSTSILETITPQRLTRPTQTARPKSPSSLFPLDVSSSTSIHLFSDSPAVEEEERRPPSKSSSFGAVPTALLTSLTCVLLLTAMAILWYFRTNNTLKAILSCWDMKQQKDYTETEEWTHTAMNEKKKPQFEAEPEVDVGKETDMEVHVNINAETQGP